jgi:mono/diheme cytochrome c family protein
MVTLLLGSALASAQQLPEPEESLGEQLYSTHCVSCHTSQVHWRDKRIARNWSSLVGQVRRWQSNVGLAWSEEYVREVARYLNSRYYHFTEEDKQASLFAPVR